MRRAYHHCFARRDGRSYELIKPATGLCHAINEDAAIIAIARNGDIYG